MTEKNHLIMQGLQSAFIDGAIQSNLAQTPQFVYNDATQGKKVFASIEDELLHCDSFMMSVAFITRSGITPLLLTFRELEKRGIKGRILTTDYLGFSEPYALEKLSELSNIELKLFRTNEADIGFHTKGYMFQKEEIYHFIIGSSNITLDALTRNMEWNTKLVSDSNGVVAQDVKREFERLWTSPFSYCYNEIAGAYRNEYEQARLLRKMVSEQKRMAAAETIPSVEQYRLKPNSMQIAFINNLKKMVESGASRALLISATGTGKTYASAFAMRELGFKKVLFLVHRNQIAVQARRSFENVFGHRISTGLVSGAGGSARDYEADYVFATVQTISRSDHLNRFETNQFEAIIYDEAHHTSAATYQKIMEYFKPKFTLGMTATPDRRDNQMESRNIYEIFDYQIAYEIRLQQAMEEELLCPFHYFGITDLALISEEGRSKETDPESFALLTCDERVKNIIQQAEYYGYSGSRVKGLIFCSRLKEAEEISNKMNTQGLRTIALSGADSEIYRAEAIERLTMDVPIDPVTGKPVASYDYLDYILTVDIFSEGTDIVEVNQVIMLRPTQSPIVFIQQLGRGLRKYEDKEYVVVLDFIGNYNNNFMIPIALSGDRTYNKDNVRRYVHEGNRVIPGSSTIHFDEISRKRIFASIDQANFSDIKLIKENYTNLKNKLGRIPALRDFDTYGEMDVLRIFDNNSLGSYYMFLKKYEKEYTVRLSQDEEKVVEFISKKLANGKRVQELLLLQRMLAYTHKLSSIGLMAALRESMQEYNKDLSALQQKNVINMMTNEFPAGSGKKTYSQCIFIEEDADDYKVSQTFAGMLANPEFYKIVQELIEFGISRYKRDYSETYAKTDLVLYQKYTYEDVCRLLNWENNEVPLNIGGYKYDKKTKTFPVFINYDKSDDISDTIKYEDHFTSNQSLIAISKSGRSLASEDVQNFLYAKERGISVELFVRKNKDDKISKEFYYLGHMSASGKTREFVMPGTDKTAVEIEWILDRPVREDIYEYIVNN